MRVSGEHSRAGYRKPPALSEAGFERVFKSPLLANINLMILISIERAAGASIARSFAKIFNLNLSFVSRLKSKYNLRTISLRFMQITSCMYVRKL